MIDNRLIQIGLVALAFYVILQIVNNQVSQEHLETAVPTSVTVTSPGAETKVQVQPTLQAANASVTPELAATTGAASARPVVTASPSATLTTSIPAPLTAVEESIVAEAPKILPEDLTSSEGNFAPKATDLEAMFGTRGTLQPSDLIPKIQSAELYGGFRPDPKLNQDFLQNSWSQGIDVSKPKRGYNNDLRGIPYPPLIAEVSPWNNPSQFPDLYRKSLGSIE